MEEFTQEIFFTLTDQRFDSLVNTYLQPRFKICSQVEYSWEEGQILQTETCPLSESQKQITSIFQLGYRSAPTYGTLLDWLCSENHIPTGKYLIFVR